MKKIIYTFLSRPVTTGMFFFSVILLGLMSFSNLPIELSPHVEFPKLTVNAYWPGVSPQAVEAYLTSPMEAAFATIKGIKTISSKSSAGQSEINLEFHPETDMDFARVNINEKIGSLKEYLPKEVFQINVSQYIPEDFRELQGFLTYTLSANESADRIRKYIRDFIKVPILSVDGVSDFQIRGGDERQINILINYQKAKAFNISNDEITKAVISAEKILSAGVIRNAESQHLVKISNEISVASVLSKQPVKINKDGSIISLGDIGTVKDDFKEKTGYYRINGKDAVYIEIDKEQGKNTVEIADKVYDKFIQLSKNFPPGFILTKEIDKSDYVRNEIGKLYSSAGYSFVILVILLFIIFRNYRYSFIIITSIVFSLISAFLLFYVFNIPLNILTIASVTLGFGLMVDNSIVVIDYLDSNYKGRGKKYLAVYTKDIFFPVFASTLTTIAVFLPLLFLTGELKLYFEEFAIAVSAALFCSLIVSFTVIPLLFVKYGFEKNKNHVNKKKGFLFRLYNIIMQKLLSWKKLSFTFLILLLGLPAWLLPAHIEIPVISAPYNLIFDSDTYRDLKEYVDYALGGSINLFFNHITKGEVFQYGESTYIMVILKLPNGNKLEEMNEISQKFENEILPYKKQFKTLTANVVNEENAYTRIEFNNEQSLSSFPYNLKNFLTAYATRLGGLNVAVYGFGPGFSSFGGSTFSFSVIATGFNFNEVKNLAEKFSGVIERNPRIDNIDINRSGIYGADENTYEILGSVDRKKLNQSEVNVNSLFDIIARNTRGNLGSDQFKIGNEEVNYSIKFSNYKNMQLDELKNLIVTGSKNNYLKVKDLVSFDKEKILSTITRENRQYIRNISFNYKGPHKYGNEFLEKSIKELNIPEGYSIKKRDFIFLFGQEEELQVWGILLASLILIFMITAALFESLKDPIIIIFAIPFAVIGTIFLFYFGDFNMDRGAYAGILLLIGLSVNNSIVLVDYIAKNLHNYSFEEILKLSFTRIRPIFTTSLTTVAAFIPLILTEGNSFWKSLSLSVTGGILLSSLLIVIYIPIIYFLLNKPVKNITNKYLF